MIKTLVLTLSLFAIVGIAFVSAEETKLEIKTDAITGKIVKVNTDEHSLVVRDAAGNETVYVFDDKTTFYRDGSVVEVKTIVPDDMVTLKLVPKKKNIILRLDTPVIEVEKE